MMPDALHIAGPPLHGDWSDIMKFSGTLPPDGRLMIRPVLATMDGHTGGDAQSGPFRKAMT